MRSKSSKTRSRSLSGNASIAAFTDSTRAAVLAVQSTCSEKRIARAPKYTCKSDGCTRRRKRGKRKLMVQPLSPLANTHLVPSEPKTTRYRYAERALQYPTFARVRCFRLMRGLGKTGCTGKAVAFGGRSDSALHASVSVRGDIESYETFVIQGGWPDSKGVTHVDGEESRAIRPRQVTISERSDRLRMGSC